MGAIIALTCPLTLPSKGQPNTGAVTETALLSAPAFYALLNHLSQQQPAVSERATAARYEHPPK